MPDRQEAADDGYFAPLAPARYMMLTTFKPNGTPVSTPVQGMTDGDRAYFRAWSRSGTVRRLRRTAAVQVTPSTVLGLFSYGPPMGATARPLRSEEASRVATKLAGKYPPRSRHLILLLHRMRRGHLLHYELLA